MLARRLEELCEAYVRNTLEPALCGARRAPAEYSFQLLGLVDAGEIAPCPGAPVLVTPWTLAQELAAGSMPDLPDDPLLAQCVASSFLRRAAMGGVRAETVLVALSALASVALPELDRETDEWLVSQLDTAAGERIVLAVVQMQHVVHGTLSAFHSRLYDILSANHSSLCRTRILQLLFPPTQPSLCDSYADLDFDTPSPQ
jgi:hypothetical protein